MCSAPPPAFAAWQTGSLPDELFSVLAQLDDPVPEEGLSSSVGGRSAVQAARLVCKSWARSLKEKRRHLAVTLGPSDGQEHRALRGWCGIAELELRGGEEGIFSADLAAAVLGSLPCPGKLTKLRMGLMTVGIDGGEKQVLRIVGSCHSLTSLSLMGCIPLHTSQCKATNVGADLWWCIRDLKELRELEIGMWELQVVSGTTLPGLESLQKLDCTHARFCDEDPALGSTDDNECDMPHLRVPLIGHCPELQELLLPIRLIALTGEHLRTGEPLSQVDVRVSSLGCGDCADFEEVTKCHSLKRLQVLSNNLGCYVPSGWVVEQLSALEEFVLAANGDHAFDEGGLVELMEALLSLPNLRRFETHEGSLMDFPEAHELMKEFDKLNIEVSKHPGMPVPRGAEDGYAAGYLWWNFSDF